MKLRLTEKKHLNKGYRHTEQLAAVTLMFSRRQALVLLESLSVVVANHLHFKIFNKGYL